MDFFGGLKTLDGNLTVIIELGNKKDCNEHAMILSSQLCFCW
jgi:hypothetical protein